MLDSHLIIAKAIGRLKSMDSKHPGMTELEYLVWKRERKDVIGFWIGVILIVSLIWYWIG